MTKLRLAVLLGAAALLPGAPPQAHADAPPGHEIREFGQSIQGPALRGASGSGPAGVGTTPADRVDTLGGLLGPIVSGSGDLSPTTPGSSSPTASNGSPSTLDSLFDDVDAEASKRCDEIARADGAGLDRQAAELDRRRQDELARLKRIEQAEQRIAGLRGEIDALDRDIAGREQTKSPEDEAQSRKMDGLRDDLDAARKELERKRFELRQLDEKNDLLRQHRDTFAAASAKLRDATARIDSLTRQIQDLQEGNRTTVTTRAGDAAYVRHASQELQGQLDAALEARAAALAEAGGALYLTHAPASLAELAAQTSQLHADWQQYQHQRQGIATRLRWLEGERIPSLERDFNAAETAGAAATARSAELDALRDRRRQRQQDYDLAREDMVTDRVAAVLAFKLDTAVRDCIDQRRVAGTSAPPPATTGGRQTVTGTITRTCYGPTTGPTVQLFRGFTYAPHEWQPMSLHVSDNNTVGFGFMPGSIYGGTRLYKTDTSGNTYLDRGTGHLDPASGRLVLRAEGTSIFNTLQGTGANLRTVRSSVWPLVLIGELRPDSSAPRGWRGHGKGQMGFKLSYRQNFGSYHGDEPCEIEWTVP